MKKLVVLTGGGGILGKKITKTLIESGFAVAVVDRDLDLAKKASVDTNSDWAWPFQCDVTSRSELESLRDELNTKDAQLYGLICNAATKSDNFFERFEDFPIEDWDFVTKVNLTGAMVCSQVFGGQLAEQGLGSIVNTLSIYGIVAPDQRIYEGSEYEGRAINTPAVYSASKAGLWGLTKYLASYWGGKGVRVNAVTPGGVFSGQNDVFVNRYSDKTMLGRMAEPQDIASAVEFLISERSSYITGHNLVVDGGWSSW